MWSARKGISRRFEARVKGGTIVFGSAKVGVGRGLTEITGSKRLRESRLPVVSGPLFSARVGSSAVEQRPFKPLVVGSNPTRPTSAIWKHAETTPSSRGLGHRPFTAVTGVRIPVGSPISTTRWPPAGCFVIAIEVPPC